MWIPSTIYIIYGLKRIGQPHYLKDGHSAYENLATVAINFLNLRTKQALGISYFSLYNFKVFWLFTAKNLYFVGSNDKKIISSYFYSPVLHAVK